MKKRKLKRFNPIFAFILLIIGTLILSQILSFVGVQAEYSTVNIVTTELTNNVVQVENLLSGHGIRYIATNAVSDFVNFTPFSMLILILIGIGMLDKSGFIKSFFTLITQSFRKNTLTFIIILLSIISSITGDIGYVIFLPLGALLFKHGRRNPLGGIVASFAGLSFGYGVNVFLSTTDTTLLGMTLNASHILQGNYTSNTLFQVLFMAIALIIISITFTIITEQVVMLELGKYEFEEIETLGAVKLTNRELRGLILGIGAGILFSLIIIYFIVPGLPFSGALLDSGAKYYIDKVFGTGSLFNKAYVFIITLDFFIIGLVYGLVAKTIKSSKDVTDGLAHSLDGIGSIIVLIFFASMFISIFKKSNIGLVITAGLSNIISNLNLTGLTLVIVLFVISLISSLFYTSLAMKWSVLSGITVPVFMNASLSPEFAQVIYMTGATSAWALSPLMAYYVIYLAFMEKYSNGEVTLFGSAKYLVPYSLACICIWSILILIFYVSGLPIGIGTWPGVSYVS